MSRCIYVSFFTQDYVEPASRLIQSLHALGLDYDVPKVADSGRWIANCARKPQFVLDMIRRHPGRPIVWTDADSVIRRRPTMFEDAGNLATADAAVCEYRWRNGKKETFSGTALFNPTVGATKLVEAWVALQQTQPEVMDQKVLAAAVGLVEDSTVRVARLPVEYCFIHDMHRQEHPGADPVFEHFQYSRVRKQKEVAR